MEDTLIGFDSILAKVKSKSFQIEFPASLLSQTDFLNLKTRNTNK